MWTAASLCRPQISLATSRALRATSLRPSASASRGTPSQAWARQRHVQRLSAPRASNLHVTLAPSAVHAWSTAPTLRTPSGRHTLRHTCEPLTRVAAQSPPRARMASGAQGGGDRLQREIKVQHILVKEGEGGLVETILKKITEGGEAMESLAQQHSLCPSGSRGGVLGWISRGQTVPNFEAAAFGAQLGEVVTASTQFGTHVIRVLEERSSAQVLQIPVEEFEVVRQGLGREGPPQLHPDDDRDGSRVQLVDVREPQEMATAAIGGFELFPLSEFGEWAPSIKDRLAPEVPTYVLCHHGMRSQQMAQWLVSQGFSEVYNISGGIDAYSTLVDPSVPRY